MSRAARDAEASLGTVWLKREEFDIAFKRGQSFEQPDISPADARSGVWVAIVPQAQPYAPAQIPRAELTNRRIGDEQAAALIGIGGCWRPPNGFMFSDGGGPCGPRRSSSGSAASHGRPSTIWSGAARRSPEGLTTRPLRNTADTLGCRPGASQSQLLSRQLWLELPRPGSHRAHGRSASYSDQYDAGAAARYGLGDSPWAFLIALGIYGVVGLAGVHLPLWHDHIDIRAAWPPITLVPGPQHRPDEPR